MAGTAQAQTDTIASYDAPVLVDLPNDTIAGIPLIRRAEFECLIYNRRASTVSTQWLVHYYTSDSLEFKVIPAKAVELVAAKDFYVQADGQFIGNIDKVLELYGTKDSTDSYIKDEAGKYLLTQPGIISEYEFFVHISTLPISIREALIGAGLSSTKLAAKWGAL